MRCVERMRAKSETFAAVHFFLCQTLFQIFPTTAKKRLTTQATNSPETHPLTVVLTFEKNVVALFSIQKKI